MQCCYGTVVIGNPERHMRKASHCGSKQQYSSHAMITLLLLVRATYMYGVVLHAYPVHGESHNQCNITGEFATVLSLGVYGKKLFFKPRGIWEKLF